MQTSPRAINTDLLGISLYCELQYRQRRTKRQRARRSPRRPAQAEPPLRGVAI